MVREDGVGGYSERTIGYEVLDCQMGNGVDLVKMIPRGHGGGAEPHLCTSLPPLFICAHLHL